MRALIVEDSRTTRAMLRHMLRELGFEVTEAVDGVDGLAKLTNGHTVDFALLDWEMPNMTGIELLQKIRALPRHQELPILMVTSLSEAHHVSEALSLGCSEYLMKPFSKEALAEKLELAGVEPDTRSARGGDDAP